MHNDYAGSMASGKWNRKHQQANYGSVSSYRTICKYRTHVQVYVIYVCVCVFIVSAEMKAKPKAIEGTLFSLIAFRILLKRKRRKQSERDGERVKCVNNNQSVIYGKGQIMRRVFVYLYYCNPCWLLSHYGLYFIWYMCVCVLLPWPFAGHTRLPFIFVQINQSTLKCRKDKGKMTVKPECK